MTKPIVTVRERFDKLPGVVVVHPMLVGKQVEVTAHAHYGAAQLAVLELEIVAPEVIEFFHLVFA